MIREQQPAISVFSIGMMGMGVVSVVSRDFAFGWQPVPEFHPGCEALAVACGLFMIAAGAALLFKAGAAKASRALLPFLLAWFCLKIPAVVLAPQIEGVWIGFGEIGMLLAGGWVLFARLSGLANTRFLGPLTGARGVRGAQILFGLSTIPVGLGHLFYTPISATLIPAWMPFRYWLAFGTGVAQIACGLAIALSLFARAAALVETALLAIFAFFVWGPNTWFATAPKMAGTPAGWRFPLTAFLITWVIGGAAWLIADSASNRLPFARSPERLPQRDASLSGAER
ncbi:DoxX family protein [Acidobacteria bacterium AB60]|nr:DoxX family protein [Acidobacteria bacterium AB60]